MTDSAFERVFMEQFLPESSNKQFCQFKVFRSWKKKIFIYFPRQRREKEEILEISSSVISVCLFYS